MFKRKFIIPILLGMVIVIPFMVYSFTFPNIFSTTRVAPTTNAHDFAEELNSKLPLLLDKYQLSGGVAVAIISDYELTWIGSSGYANEEQNIPITNQTYFQIASMSKSFCAWAVMDLYEKGLIDLDDPVENYLTRWNLPDTGYNNSEVTIRRILSHTAGLSLESFLGYAPEEELPSIEDALADVKVIATPGSTWMYSGGGFLVLQLLIEEVSHQSYADYVTNEILQPLNLTHSYPDWVSEIENSAAHAYDPFGHEIPTYRFTALAAGGHYSTIVDLAGFVLVNMNGSQGQAAGREVLNASTIELMQTPLAEVHPYMGGYGLGFQVKMLSNGQKMVYHNGQNTGFLGTMNFMPESGEGLVILASSDAAKSLIIEIESQWQQMIQGSLQKTLLASKYVIVFPIISCLALLFLTLNIIMGYRLSRGEIQWGFCKKGSRIALACLFMLLLVVAIVVFYVPIRYRSSFIFVFWFLPEMHWIPLILSISLPYYSILSLTYRRHPSPIIAGTTIDQQPEK